MNLIVLHQQLMMATILNAPKVEAVYNFDFTGSYTSKTLPAGTYLLEVWGAEGGYRNSASYSGKGGYSKGILTLTSSTTLYIYPGGSGNSVSSSSNSIYPGGFNGGGYRYKYKGGGGASDIRIGSTSLLARVIVAGGGGSDGATSKAGAAGGGTSGVLASSGFGTNQGGGHPTCSGSSSSTTASAQVTTNNNASTSTVYGGFGFGGFGAFANSGYGGGGGGGWYGGSGTYPDSSADDDKGGSGGSGYVYTSATASQYPSGCLLNSAYYLSGAETIAGNLSFLSPSGSSETGHSGNGYCRITKFQ